MARDFGCFGSFGDLENSPQNDQLIWFHDHCKATDLCEGTIIKGKIIKTVFLPKEVSKELGNHYLIEDRADNKYFVSAYAIFPIDQYPLPYKRCSGRRQRK